MKLTLVIKMDNAAFQDGNAVDEIERMCKKLFDGDTYGTLLDINGNRVGKYIIKSR